ncbi:hypothetical protein B296_00042895 [Ensete ventricosum]|uniref:Uncharacterized protein n=1 Tax=Ensete ventricosum TaxID=4639 RepID=A0A426Y4C2_ENSVE|nr:hypothetical protein B296_00042895 [Ensete ventricosum]
MCIMLKLHRYLLGFSFHEPKPIGRNRVYPVVLRRRNSVLMTAMANSEKDYGIKGIAPLLLSQGLGDGHRASPSKPSNYFFFHPSFLLLFYHCLGVPMADGLERVRWGFSELSGRSQNLAFAFVDRMTLLTGGLDMAT